MSGKKKAVIWIIVLGVLGSIGGTIAYKKSQIKRYSTILGSVIREDKDPPKRQPIPKVKIVTQDGRSVTTESDATGFFRLILAPRLVEGESITLQFRHPDYKPLDLTQSASENLWIARMVPNTQESVEAPPSKSAEVAVADVRVRYSTKAMTTQNVGSIVRTFEVTNKGNTPCVTADPCSPDGKWKATIGSLELDAGEKNEFRNSRVSCIAGPCAFTKVEADGISSRGRKMTVSVRNWSETATFLVEAEVVHTAVSDMVRRSYPVIFGRAMNFTLPGPAVGPSIEAEVNGASIIFPLGPQLILSWANCSVKTGQEEAKLYRCELKPGYRFQDTQANR